MCKQVHTLFLRNAFAYIQLLCLCMREVSVAQVASLYFEPDINKPGYYIVICLVEKTVESGNVIC